MSDGRDSPMARDRVAGRVGYSHLFRGWATPTEPQTEPALRPPSVGLCRRMTCSATSIFVYIANVKANFASDTWPPLRS